MAAGLPPSSGEMRVRGQQFETNEYGGRRYNKEARICFEVAVQSGWHLYCIRGNTAGHPGGGMRWVLAPLVCHSILAEELDSHRY